MHVWRRNSRKEDLPELRAPMMRMLEASQSELWVSVDSGARFIGMHKMAIIREPLLWHLQREKVVASKVTYLKGVGSFLLLTLLGLLIALTWLLA